MALLAVAVVAKMAPVLFLASSCLSFGPSHIKSREAVAFRLKYLNLLMSILVVIHI